MNAALVLRQVALADNHASTEYFGMQVCCLPHSRSGVVPSVLLDVAGLWMISARIRSSPPLKDGHSVDACDSPIESQKVYSALGGILLDESKHRFAKTTARVQEGKKKERMSDFGTTNSP
jgi:hypothetical protein